MRSSSEKYTTVLLAIVSIYMLGGPSIFSHDEIVRAVAETGSGQVYQYVFVIGALGLFCRILATDTTNTLRMCQGEHWLILVWCVASVAWSLFPLIAARRVFMLALTTVTLVMCVRSLPTARVIWTVCMAMVFILLLDYAAVMLGFGVHGFADVEGALAGNWRGIHPHKNPAGAFAASSTIFTFWLAVGTRHRGVSFLHILCALFLGMTGSKTAIVLGVVSAYGVAAIFFLSRFWSSTVSAAMVLVAAAIFYWLFWDSSWLQLNEESFTGRGLIWQTLWPDILANSNLGVGYGSYWGLGDNSPVLQLTSSFVSFLTQGHNGYLDLILTVGVVGLGMTILCFFIVPLLRIRNARGYLGPMCVSIIAFNIGYNFMESSLLAPSFPNWFFLVLVFALTQHKLAMGRAVAVNHSTP